MNEFHIVCTDQVPVNVPLNHAHIVAVGIDTDNDGWANVQHSLQAVIVNIQNKRARYYTIGDHSGEKAYVEVVFCKVCNHLIIKTYPDDTTDNNLDSLRICSWKAQ